jgi:hypothetical protein
MKPWLKFKKKKKKQYNNNNNNNKNKISSFSNNLVTRPLVSLSIECSHKKMRNSI